MKKLLLILLVLFFSANLYAKEVKESGWYYKEKTNSWHYYISEKERRGKLVNVLGKDGVVRQEQVGVIEDKEKRKKYEQQQLRALRKKQEKERIIYIVLNFSIYKIDLNPIYYKQEQRKRDIEILKQRRAERKRKRDERYHKNKRDKRNSVRGMGRMMGQGMGR